MSINLDLGHGVRIKTMIRDPEECGIVLEHQWAGEPCRHEVFWREPEGRHVAVWQLVSREPLTLSPSIRGEPCGVHGFIREGRWIPA